ncbi:MAG: hypothetical protein V4813_19690 [Gemmatimonadota bacterium]
MMLESNRAGVLSMPQAADAPTMRSLAVLALCSALMLVAVNAAEAQGRGNGNGNGKGNGQGRGAQGIPPGHLPPAGSCRVWYDGRPPGQQAAPTSCSTARLIAARDGGRVIYGDGARRDDRRYDDTRAPDRIYPQTLPEMVWGVVFGRGERQDEVRRWVDGTSLRATVVDVDRNGQPEAVTWTDDNGVVVQRWTDTNRDGRADRVTVYKNKKVLRVIR